jgi:hypothetical protein
MWRRRCSSLISLAGTTSGTGVDFGIPLLQAHRLLVSLAVATGVVGV